jgi:hypothetical protein
METQLTDKQSLYILKEFRSVFFNRIDFGVIIKLGEQEEKEDAPYKYQQPLWLEMYSIGPSEPINMEIGMTIPIYVTSKNETIIKNVSACHALIKGDLKKLQEKLFFLAETDELLLAQNKNGQYEFRFSLTENKDALLYIEETFLKAALLKWSFWTLRNCDC